MALMCETLSGSVDRTIDQHGESKVASPFEPLDANMLPKRQQSIEIVK